MDFERNDYPPFPPQEGPVPPQPGPPEPPRTLPPYLAYQPPPPPRHSGWRVIWGVLFGLSVLANVGLFLLFLAVAVVAAGRGGARHLEAVVRDGPSNNKIVLVHVGGLIDGEQAEEVHRQIRAAKQDSAVRGIILNVDSPGGTISASDQIYREIMDYRRGGRPAVAFMQGMAASGGYYASVACDEIVAEPTAVTGSIGVLMMHFVFQDLLENKLGIQPVFLTMGDKKDWPSSFRMPKDEELAYIRRRLLEPAYKRFVDVVKEGRKDTLSADEVEKLADGSIFCADEALAVKLIDKIGYLDEAIARAKALAGVQQAQVVEYRRPLSLLGMLSARAKSPSILRLDRMKLLELGTPQVMYLWNAY
jgi:protease-4